MSEKPFTLVYYYIPEDFDDPQMPNAFALSKLADEVTLTDIEKSFPLAGEFVYRFKYKYNGAAVWMDLSNKTCRVPKVDGRIYLKVTRKVPKYTVTSSSQSAAESNASMNDYLLQNDLLDF